MDLITSFGTMIWSPVKWSRPAWDLVFIIDFTFSGILLIPQILAWVYRKPEGLRRRALASWLVLAVATLAVADIGVVIGAALSVRGNLAAIGLVASRVPLPAIRHPGHGS